VAKIPEMAAVSGTLVTNRMLGLEITGTLMPSVNCWRFALVSPRSVWCAVAEGASTTPVRTRAPATAAAVDSR